MPHYSLFFRMACAAAGAILAPASAAASVMLFIINSPANNGRKDYKDNHSADDRRCIHHSLPLFGRGSNRAHRQAVVVVLIFTNHHIDEECQRKDGYDGADAEGNLMQEQAADLVDDQGY